MIKYNDFRKALKTINRFEEALKIVNEHEESLRIVNEYKSQIKEVKEEISYISRFSNANKEMYVFDFPLSVRLMNVLKSNGEDFVQYSNISQYGDFKIKEFENLSERRFLMYRGAGHGLLKEIKQLCFCAGVSLKS